MCWWLCPKKNELSWDCYVDEKDGPRFCVFATYPDFKNTLLFLFQILFCSANTNLWTTFFLLKKFFIRLLTYFVDDIYH